MPSARPTPSLAATSALLVALASAGCGSSEPAKSPPPLPPSESVSQFDAFTEGSAGLGEPEQRARLRAVAMLRMLGPGGVPGLLDALRDDDPVVVREAVRCLAGIGPIIVPELTDALGNEGLAVREGAARALGSIRPLQSELLDSGLHGGAPETRRLAALALSCGGDEGREVLRRGAASPDEEVRRISEEALAMAPPDAPPIPSP